MKNVNFLNLYILFGNEFIFKFKEIDNFIDLKGFHVDEAVDKCF